MISRYNLKEEILLRTLLIIPVLPVPIPLTIVLSVNRVSTARGGRSAENGSGAFLGTAVITVQIRYQFHLSKTLGSVFLVHVPVLSS